MSVANIRVIATKNQQNDTNTRSRTWEEGRKTKNHTVEMWAFFFGPSCTANSDISCNSTISMSADMRRSRRWDGAVANVSSDDSAFEVVNIIPRRKNISPSLEARSSIERRGRLVSTLVTCGANTRFRCQSEGWTSNFVVLLSLSMLIKNQGKVKLSLCN